MNIHELIQEVIEIRHEEEHPAQVLLANIRDALQKSGWGPLEEFSDRVFYQNSRSIK
jgi:hypothetical protein